MQLPSGNHLLLVALVIICGLTLLAELRALFPRRPRPAPAAPPTSLTDAIAREVNGVVAELRAHQLELQQLHTEELAAVEVRARRAEARAARAIPPAEVGAIIGSLRTVAQELGDVASSLAGQVKALQRERAAARVEALTGKALDGSPQPGPLDDSADRKTDEHPRPAADDWEDRTRVCEGSGRRPAIRPEAPAARRVAS